MFTILGRTRSAGTTCSRRDLLRVGALAVGGLSMADLLRLRALAGTRSAGAKSVIMVYLSGGPAHLDMYDMKPSAAVEFRGEFRPIKSNVAGMEICELMPRQARLMDKLTILRGMHFVEEHSAHYVWTGVPERVYRPAFGSVVSYFKSSPGGLPPYVSLMDQPLAEVPAYTGPAHSPFFPSGPGLKNLSLVEGVSRPQLADRKQLLGQLEMIRRGIDGRGGPAGVDPFTVRALDMVASTRAREAFDLDKEPLAVREMYGKANERFLLARRLVEAGIAVVTVQVDGWDTHSDNFKSLRSLLPQLDQGLHALVSDLHVRGLNGDVAVVVWGEFGRTPRVNVSAGRDHWTQAGFAVLAGSTFKTGQVIGETDSRGESPKGLSMSSSHVLTSLYQHLGIEPAWTIPDHNGRPMYLVDERDPVPGLT